jgi:hypothetical protein
VTLLDPGTLTEARTGPGGGTISMSSGSGILHPNQASFFHT